MSIQDSRTNEEISNTVCQQDHYSVMEGGRGFEGCDQCCRIKEALDAKDSKISSLEAKVVELEAERAKQSCGRCRAVDLVVAEQSLLLQELARALKNRYHDGKCLNCGYPIFNCVPTCEWEVALIKLNKFQKEEIT